MNSLRLRDLEVGDEVAVMLRHKPIDITKITNRFAEKVIIDGYSVYWNISDGAQEGQLADSNNQRLQIVPATPISVDAVYYKNALLEIQKRINWYVRVGAPK